MCYSGSVDCAFVSSGPTLSLSTLYHYVETFGLSLGTRQFPCKRPLSSFFLPSYVGGRNGRRPPENTRNIRYKRWRGKEKDRLSVSGFCFSLKLDEFR